MLQIFEHIVLPEKGLYGIVYFLSTPDKMNIILFATLSVPVLGGAGSLRKTTPRVSAFGGAHRPATPSLPAFIGQPPSLYPTFVTPEPQDQAINRKMPSPLCLPGTRQTKAQENACVPEHKLACS